MMETQPKKLLDVGATITAKGPRPVRMRAELTCPVCGLRQLEVEQTGHGLFARCKRGCDGTEVSQRIGLSV